MDSYIDILGLAMYRIYKWLPRQVHKNLHIGKRSTGILHDMPRFKIDMCHKKKSEML